MFDKMKEKNVLVVFPTPEGPEMTNNGFLERSLNFRVEKK